MIQHIFIIIMVLSQGFVFFGLGVMFSINKHARPAIDGWKDTLNEWDKSTEHYRHLLFTLDQQRQINLAKIITKSHMANDIRVVRRMLREEFFKNTDEEKMDAPILQKTDDK